MRRISFCTLCVMVAMVFSSCEPSDSDAYKSFVGSWGVERIEYYDLDYAGNPIPGSLETHDLVPGDPKNGIDLIFREDKTGEMRDRSQDTLWLDLNPESETYETVIICPDTTLVETFTYSYDEEASALYLNMSDATVFMMTILDLTDNSFTYVNEYEEDKIEKTYLRRLSDTPASKARRQNQKRPYKPGSFLSGR